MYEKTTWEAQTPISPSRLNNMDSQYSTIMEHWQNNSFRVAVNEEIKVEVLSSAPTHAEGRVYFNSNDGLMYCSSGTNWWPIKEA